MEPACWLLNTLDQSHFLELDERRALVEVRPQRDLDTVAFLGVLGRLRGLRFQRNLRPQATGGEAAAGRARARSRALGLAALRRGGGGRRLRL